MGSIIGRWSKGRRSAASLGALRKHATRSGKTLIGGLGLAREGRSAVREFKELLIDSELKIGLQASPGSKAPSVISEVEFIAE